MNHDVAVRTRPVLEHAGLLIDRCVAASRYGEKLAGMKHIGVAALAQHRLLHDQQRLMGGAVRVVAIEATFTDWRVLPQEGTALFAVALVTLVIDRVCRNEPLRLRAVRIMAVRANHLLFPQGMMRRLHDRRADLLMAPSAKLHLAWLRQQFGIAPVNLMAVNAGEFCLIVLAAVPQRHVSPGVASQTNGILGGGGQGLGKVHQAANPTAAAAAHVIGRRPVATLASLMPRRRFGIAVNAHAIVYVADEFIVMAARA
jgi:hypothetical protein